MHHRRTTQFEDSVYNTQSTVFLSLSLSTGLGIPKYLDHAESLDQDKDGPLRTALKTTAKDQTNEKAWADKIFVGEYKDADPVVKALFLVAFVDAALKLGHCYKPARNVRKGDSKGVDLDACLNSFNCSDVAFTMQVLTVQGKFIVEEWEQEVKTKTRNQRKNKAGRTKNKPSLDSNWEVFFQHANAETKRRMEYKANKDEFDEDTLSWYEAAREEINKRALNKLSALGGRSGSSTPSSSSKNSASAANEEELCSYLDETDNMNF